MSDVKDVRLKGQRLVAASEDWIQALPGQSQMSQPWAATLNQMPEKGIVLVVKSLPFAHSLPPPPPHSLYSLWDLHYAVVTTDTIFQIIIHLRFLFKHFGSVAMYAVVCF